MARLVCFASFEGSWKVVNIKRVKPPVTGLEEQLNQLKPAKSSKPTKAGLGFFNFYYYIILCYKNTC